MIKTICDERACIDVLDVLGIKYTSLGSVELAGYECVHTESRNFYFQKVEAELKHKYILLSMDEREIWELDKFQSNLGYRKQRIDGYEDCFIYEKREGGFEPSEYHQLERIASYKERNLQLDCCDVYLLVPGKLEKGPDTWDKIAEKRRDVFDVFQRNATNCVEEEYNSDFAWKLSRKCIGEVTLEICDRTDETTYYQDALIGIVKHSTGICALEIMIQNCAVGGNKILNYYCGNLLHFIYEGQKYNLTELLKKLHIRSYGKRRSMIFSYGNVKDEEIINALANEEFPMGKISGDFEQKLLHENVAQYDTAEVYVSEETMFEKCPAINVYANQRLAYHAIEIFFVELILFQDAAVDKVNDDLTEEGERQKGYRKVEDAIARCEEISFDMSRAIRFGDYDQFNFPTVRQSAKKIAKNFGIDRVFEKYQMNKMLLESMIQANKRKVQEQQERIKNRFLFLLSAVAAVGTLGDIFHVLYEDRIGGVLSYVASFVIIAVVFGVYKLTMYLLEYLSKRRVIK